MSVTPRQTRELFSDFFKDLTDNPVNNDLARKTNEEAVKESIKNLLLTDKGERPFQPELGSDIRKMLFENLNQVSIITSREAVKEVIQNFEPRANLIGVDLKSSVDSNAVQITVVFNVINSQEDITLTTTIQRVR